MSFSMCNPEIDVVMGYIEYILTTVYPLMLPINLRPDRKRSRPSVEFAIRAR